LCASHKSLHECRYRCPDKALGWVLVERIRPFIVGGRADSRLPVNRHVKVAPASKCSRYLERCLACVPPSGDRVETAWPSSNRHTIIVEVRSTSSSIWLSAITGRSNGPASMRSDSSPTAPG